MQTETFEVVVRRKKIRENQGGKCTIMVKWPIASRLICYITSLSTEILRTIILDSSTVSPFGLNWQISE